MQLPAELQKFLLQPAHLDPELAGHFEKREVIHGLGQLQELAAARAEVRAECALVAAPANEGRIRECRDGTHKLLFKKYPEGTKKVAGGCGCQPLVRLACALLPLEPSQRRRAQTEVRATRP